LEALVDTPGELDTHPLAVITRSPVANHTLRLVDRPMITVRTSLMPYLSGLSGSGSEGDIRLLRKRRYSSGLAADDDPGCDGRRHLARAVERLKG
jgi:hypothetical protein